MTFVSVIRDVGTLGGCGVVLLVVFHQVRGFLNGFRHGERGEQWHLVRCTRCNKELEYAGEFGCERPKDPPGTEYG